MNIHEEFLRYTEKGFRKLLHTACISVLVEYLCGL
jgi:hypothetical protein